MTDRQEEHREKAIELEYELDAAPQKVWRAISIPEFRQTGFHPRHWPTRNLRPASPARRSATGCGKASRPFWKAW